MHNGPITTIEELDSLVQDKKRHDKALHKSLNLKIRLCKLTFTHVKVTCPLFQQQKLNIEQKRKNLESPISTQLDLQVKVDMSDLETATTKCSENVETEKVLDDDSLDKELQQLEEVTINQDANLTCWPPNEGEFIIGLFPDGYYPGEVIKVQSEYIEADFLVQVSIAQMKKDSSLRKHPSMDRSKRHKVHQSSILQFGV